MDDISVSLFTPFRLGATWIENVGAALTDYQHVLAAFGGYISASFSMAVNRDSITSWLQNGLGRHVETYDADGNQVWEGWVNRVRISVGSVELTIGPVSDMTNQVSGIYTPKVLNAGVVSAGKTQATTRMIPAPGASTPIELRALRSQKLYGVWQRQVSEGTVFPDDADSILMSFLGENCMPALNRSNLELGGQGDNTVKVECLGYMSFFDAFLYGSTGALALSADDKLRQIIRADPNRIFSRDFSQINVNGTVTMEAEKPNQKASAVLKTIINLGGPNDTRWVMGVGNGRRVYYRPASVRVDYLQFVYDPLQRITTVAGMEVRPWQVQPARWLLNPDLVPLDTHDEWDPWGDTSCGFIEQLTYTAPHGLSITGSKFSSLTNKLARMGLGSLS